MNDLQVGKGHAGSLSQLTLLDVSFGKVRQQGVPVPTKRFRRPLPVGEKQAGFPGAVSFLLGEPPGPFQSSKVSCTWPPACVTCLAWPRERLRDAAYR